ncbi:DUF4129 domain-containing protein, partial [Streptomyces beihaiensis]
AAAGGGTGGGPPTGTLALLALAALLVVVVPLLPMLGRRRVRAVRLAPGGRTDSDAAAARTLAVWREVIDTAWDHGIAPDDSLTPRKAAARIARLGRLDPVTAEAVHRVAAAVEQVLYAPRPRPVSGLGEDVRRLRAGLYATADRSGRLRATFAPRSTVRVVWVLSERRDALARRVRGRWSAVRRPSGQGG